MPLKPAFSHISLNIEIESLSLKFKYVGAFETIESKILCIEYGHGQLSWLYIFMVPLADFYCNIFYVKMFYKRSSEITL